MEMNEGFYTFLTTSLLAFLLKIAHLAYNSKCQNVDFCCCHIQRDTITGERELEFVTTHTKPQGINNRVCFPTIFFILKICITLYSNIIPIQIEPRKREQ